MSAQAVCPYYACNEDRCDVGCGYISSHDASMISRYCSADFKACSKYHELLVGASHQQNGAISAPTPLALPNASIRSADNRNIALGLIGGGLAVLVYIFYKVGFFGIDVRVPALALLAAALLQLMAGTVALKKKSIRAIMFIGGGLFWTSLLALEILPASGLGTSTAVMPMSGYLVLWGFFGLIPAQAGIQVSRVCRHFYSLNALFLFMLAIQPFLPEVLHLTVYGTGITTGICGLWAGGQYFTAAVEAAPELDRKRVRT